VNGHQLTQAVDSPGVGFEATTTLPRLVALGHVAGQAAFDVLEPVGEDGASFGQSGHPDLEVASPALDL
jgi:hypothetical protein